MVPGAVPWVSVWIVTKEVLPELAIFHGHCNMLPSFLENYCLFCCLSFVSCRSSGSVSFMDCLWTLAC